MKIEIHKVTLSHYQLVILDSDNNILYESEYYESEQEIIDAVISNTLEAKFDPYE